MNKQQLAAKIWASANKMRSKIEANEYKDYILGFIFYKFISDKLVDSLRAEGWDDNSLKEYLNEDNSETVEYCQNKFGYFIAYNDLFSTWLDPSTPFSVADVRDALTRFARLISPQHTKVYAKIFDTLQNGLSKLGESTGAQTKAISNLLELIKDIPTDGSQDYDVLGFIYEYLISNFAANAGKKAGEFYTPHEVALMMSEIVAHHLRDAKEIKIYDPTSGSGSLLLNIGRSVGKYIEDKNKIVYYAQELKEATYNLTRMNLVMRGILPDNIVVRNGDTLEEDWPWFDDQDPHNSYEPLYCDAVVSNPPYSQEWTPKEESKTDPRYKNYGVAPKSTADYAFLLHDLYHVKPGGIMTIVLPHGVLFRGGEEGNIRKNLVENNNIDAIIGLPANIFFGTGIPTIVMVLKQKRDRDDILIVDASKGFEKVGKNNQLRARDIRKIVDAVTERREIPKFSKLITRQDVRDNDYNLNIPRYVNSADSDEQWDINAIMFGGIPNSEIDTFKDVWNTFPTLREQIFAPVSDKYSRLRQADVDEVVMQNGDFNSFISRYNAALVDMPYQLRKELFEEYQTVNVGKKIREITTNLFSRVKPFEPIIDSYAAYQLLEDQWNLISNDLEILQTEGIEAARVCDPKMEIKKKDGKDVEVQVGWQGRVMPFEIVQEYLLPEMLEEYQAKKDELENTRERIQEILSAAQELDPQPNYLKDDGSAFVPKEVKAECKRIKARIKAKESDPESLDEQILEVDSLLEKEKVQKKDIAAFYDELIAATMDMIANLSDDEIVEVLHRKHLVPMFNAIAELPMQQESQLVAAIYALNSKYGETLVDIDKTISESEKSLAKLVDNLTGSDADMAGLREFQKLLRHE
jgi:type I restriction enzyme M protein